MNVPKMITAFVMTIAAIIGLLYFIFTSYGVSWYSGSGGFLLLCVLVNLVFMILVALKEEQDSRDYLPIVEEIVFFITGVLSGFFVYFGKPARG